MSWDDAGVGASGRGARRDRDRQGCDEARNVIRPGRYLVHPMMADRPALIP